MFLPNIGNSRMIAIGGHKTDIQGINSGYKAEMKPKQTWQRLCVRLSSESKFNIKSPPQQSH